MQDLNLLSRDAEKLGFQNIKNTLDLIQKSEIKLPGKLNEEISDLINSVNNILLFSNGNKKINFSKIKGNFNSIIVCKKIDVILKTIEKKLDGIDLEEKNSFLTMVRNDIKDLKFREKRRENIELRDSLKEEVDSIELLQRIVDEINGFRIRLEQIIDAKKSEINLEQTHTKTEVKVEPIVIDPKYKKTSSSKVDETKKPKETPKEKFVLDTNQLEELYEGDNFVATLNEGWDDLPYGEKLTVCNFLRKKEDKTTLKMFFKAAEYPIDNLTNNQEDKLESIINYLLPKVEKQESADNIVNKKPEEQVKPIEFKETPNIKTVKPGDDTVNIRFVTGSNRRNPVQIVEQIIEKPIEKEVLEKNPIYIVLEEIDIKKEQYKDLPFVKQMADLFDEYSIYEAFKIVIDEKIINYKLIEYKFIRLFIEILNEKGAIDLVLNESFFYILPFRIKQKLIDKLLDYGVENLKDHNYISDVIYLIENMDKKTKFQEELLNKYYLSYPKEIDDEEPEETPEEKEEVQDDSGDVYVTSGELRRFGISAIHGVGFKRKLLKPELKTHTTVKEAGEEAKIKAALEYHLGLFYIKEVFSKFLNSYFEDNQNNPIFVKEVLNIIKDYSESFIELFTGELSKVKLNTNFYNNLLALVGGTDFEYSDSKAILEANIELNIIGADVSITSSSIDETPKKLETEEELTEISEEIELYKNQISKLKEYIQSLETERESLISKNVELLDNEKSEELLIKIEQLEEEIEEYKNNLKNLESKYNALNKKYDILNDKYKQRGKKITSLEKKLENRDSKITSLEEEIASLARVLEKKNYIVWERDNELEKLQTKISRFKDNDDYPEKRVEPLEEDKSEKKNIEAILEEVPEVEKNPIIVDKEINPFGRHYWEKRERFSIQQKLDILKRIEIFEDLELFYDKLEPKSYGFIISLKQQKREEKGIEVFELFISKFQELGEDNENKDGIIAALSSNIKALRGEEKKVVKAGRRIMTADKQEEVISIDTLEENLNPEEDDDIVIIEEEPENVKPKVQLKEKILDEENIIIQNLSNKGKRQSDEKSWYSIGVEKLEGKEGPFTYTFCTAIIPKLKNSDITALYNSGKIPNTDEIKNYLYSVLEERIFSEENNIKLFRELIEFKMSKVGAHTINKEKLKETFRKVTEEEY